MTRVKIRHNLQVSKSLSDCGASESLSLDTNSYEKEGILSLSLGKISVPCDSENISPSLKWLSISGRSDYAVPMENVVHVPLSGIQARRCKNSLHCPKKAKRLTLSISRCTRRLFTISSITFEMNSHVVVMSGHMTIDSRSS